MDTKKKTESEKPDDGSVDDDRPSTSHKRFDERKPENPDQFSMPECLSAAVDESRYSQNLKSFTQAEVIPADSDSGGEVGDAYDADVDDVFDDGGKQMKSLSIQEPGTSNARAQNEREQIYELFQPWALRTYGDQAKTKTITLRKKARILKALEGKEHSRPDSSKFRFWVKSKAFTTKRPEDFVEIPGSQSKSKPFPPGAVLSESPSEVDLFVASTSKEFGKRIYRKVAVVEEFFEIIYNVHMELGGRSGMHAGQKRTYRIITETYAFLPREAVTRFLTTCPECKKNLRPSTPSTSSGQNEDPPNNESSSEVEALNYSSHTESSIEGGPTKATIIQKTALTTKARKRRHSQQQVISMQHKQKRKDETIPKQRQQQHQLPKEQTDQPAIQLTLPQTVQVPTDVECEKDPTTSTDLSSSRIKSLDYHSGGSLSTSTAGPSPFSSFLSSIPPFPDSRKLLQDEKLNVNLPKIRINPNFQRRRRLSSPTLIATEEPVPTSVPSIPLYSLPSEFSSVKTQENLLRYYEFTRRFYDDITRQHDLTTYLSTPATHPLIQVPTSTAIHTPSIYGPPLYQSLSFRSKDNEQKKVFLREPALEIKTLTAPFGSVDEMAKPKNVEGGNSAHYNIFGLPSNVTVDVPVGAGEASTSAVTPILKRLRLSSESERRAKPPAIGGGTRSVLKIPLLTQKDLSGKEQSHLYSMNQQQQSSAINLSKFSLFRSSDGKSITQTTGTAAVTASTSATATTSASTTKAECSSSASAYYSTTVSDAYQSSKLVQPSGTGSSLRIPNVISPTIYSSASTGAVVTPTMLTTPQLLSSHLKPITSTYLQLTRSMGLSDEDALRFDNLVSNDLKYSL